jgi:hypothetical protein
VLAAPDGLSDEELVKMAEDAAPTRQTRPAKGEPTEIPVPKRSVWGRILRRDTR